MVAELSLESGFLMNGEKGAGLVRRRWDEVLPVGELSRGAGVLAQNGVRLARAKERCC
jgi:hypothetical protein